MTELKDIKMKKNCIIPEFNSWFEIEFYPIIDQLYFFNKAIDSPRPLDTKKDLRSYAAKLLESHEITINEYVSIFGGHAIYHLTEGENGQFVNASNDVCINKLVEIYSRAKYGSFKDIRYLANLVVFYLSQEIDNPNSSWRLLFNEANAKQQDIVLMTTGWRNVPSTANILFEMVVDDINIKLASLCLPTIINVKLPRIAAPCENYASLTMDERESVNLTQDHIIPDRNFYQWSEVHVIFADDVLVTGSTADKIFYESTRNGAKSFRSIFPIVIDPVIALNDAAVEERLNMVVIKEQLDKTVAQLLSSPSYRPILRTIRMVFSNKNYAALKDFIPLVPKKTWLALYSAALGNDFLLQKDCFPSLTLLRNFLIDNNLLSHGGTPLRHTSCPLD